MERSNQKRLVMKNVLTLIIFSLFISCIKQVSTSYPDDFSVPDIPIKKNAPYLNLNSDYIFDQESLHTFQLKIQEIC